MVQAIYRKAAVTERGTILSLLQRIALTSEGPSPRVCWQRPNVFGGSGGVLLRAKETAMKLGGGRDRS